MNKDIKTKWLEALRSGKYTQTIKTLREVNKDGTEAHCCLGVLCELYREDTGDGEWNEEEGYTGSFVTEKQGKFEGQGTPPSTVVKWSGMENDNPMTDIEEIDDVGDTKRLSFAELNDSGKTFKEIADIIEYTL